MLTLAVWLVMGPATILLPVTLGFIVDPLWILEDRRTFVLFIAFYGLPWIMAGIPAYAAATVGDERGGARRGK